MIMDILEISHMYKHKVNNKAISEQIQNTIQHSTHNIENTFFTQHKYLNSTVGYTRCRKTEYGQKYKRVPNIDLKKNIVQAKNCHFLVC